MRAFVSSPFCVDNEIRGDSRPGDRQDAPHPGKEPRPGNVRGADSLFKAFAVFGDPGGESAYRQRMATACDEVFQ